jgi:SAM-dependent methyltransferase
MQALSESFPSPTAHQVRLYQDAFARHGDSPSAVLWPRGRQSLRFDALTHHFSGTSFSVLDYGCGLAHLKDYLDKRFTAYRYIGADVVPEFVHAVKNKHPEVLVHLVHDYTDLIDPVDHVVISGTFNIVDGEDSKAYLTYVHAALEHLYSLCRISLSVNFMTDKVDFIQANAHHVDVEAMYRFFRDRLSSRLQLDQTRMPYEFTITALCDKQILRPENIYEPL